MAKRKPKPPEEVIGETAVTPPLNREAASEPAAKTSGQNDDQVNIIYAPTRQSQGYSPGVEIGTKLKLPKDQAASYLSKGWKEAK